MFGAIHVCKRNIETGGLQLKKKVPWLAIHVCNKGVLGLRLTYLEPRHDLCFDGNLDHFGVVGSPK